MPDYVSKITPPGSNTTYDIKSYKTASIPMGAVDTTSTSTLFSATVDGITELRDGVTMWLKNGKVTSASGYTINVNGLGAKPVYMSNTASTRSTTEFNVNYTCLFVYNSTRVTNGCWDFVVGYNTNTTYSAGTGISLSGTTINHSNSVTAGTAKGDDSKTLTFGGTFAIPSVTYDAQGHITAKGTTTMTMPSNPNTDRYVNSAAFADDTTSNASNPVKMTLTRAGSDTVTVTANIPKVSSSSAGVVPKGATVSSQSTSTKFLREDGTWSAPSYPTVNNKTLTLKGAGTSVTTFTANASADTSLDIVAGSNVTVTPDATNKKITVASSHPTITTDTDTTSTASPAHGGTFTTVDSVTRDSNGHVTKINTKTVTLPSDNNTTYTVATGDANGQIKVTPSTGSAYNVDVKGLGAAAYKGVTDNSSSTAVTSTDTNLITARTLYYAGYTKNTGTVTKVSTGAGLTGGDITGTGTVKAKLQSETKFGADATTVSSPGNVTTQIYPVLTDKTNGNLAVHVPWTDHYAWSDITGKPSTFTPSSHTHGNLQNGGTLQTNDITIANGDKLVVTDSSDSSKIARTSVSFDGSTTNTALTPKGTFESFAQHYGDLQPIISKTFTNVIATSNDFAGGWFFYGKVLPTDYYAMYKVHYRITTIAAGRSDSKTVCDIWVCGTQASLLAYASFNSFANSSYYAQHNNVLYRANSTGITNQYGHLLGIRLQSAWNPTTAANSRTVTVDIIETNNCTFSFFDNMTLYANVPGTGSTNYSGYTEMNATSQGLQETGDADSLDSVICYFNMKTGSNGIWATSLVMEDGNGTYQNICTASDGTATSSNRTTATTKKVNTNGFRVGSPIYYANTSYNANSSINGWGVIRTMQGNLFDARYSFNVTLTANSLTPFAPIYLVGTINSTDGLFYLDSTWWTQTPNSTDKVYVLVGGCYDSTTSNCRISLIEHNLWYRYDGTRLVVLNTADTKNTAGSTDTSSKIFLVGATSQTASSQTYSHDTAYVGDNGHLYSNSKQVVNLSDSQALTNKTYNGYTLGAACAKGVDTTVTNGSSNLITSGAVYTAIDNLPEPMVFKGSLGTGGTITALPVNGTASIGDTYKVITAGTYASQTAKVGDTFICDSKTSSANTWTLIPSGDEPSGTVTSVTIKATSPISIDSTDAITTSGTRTLSHANSGVTAGTYKSVTVNATGHITAGSNPTTLSGYGITDAKIASGVITLGSNTITPLTASSTLDATKLSGTIPSGCYTDTKNTAGSTNTTSKIFLVGAESQATNPQTYSHETAYVGTDGHVYSNNKQVVNLSDSQALTNKTYNGYTLAAACAKSVVTSIDTSASLPTSNAVKTFVEGKGYVTTDTKNTAGSTDTSSKIFLIGATSQAANPQTYSDNEVYATSGVLTTKKVQVGGGSCTMEYNSTTQSLDFVFT